MGDVIQEYELIEVLGRPSREDAGYAYWLKECQPNWAFRI